MQPQVNEIIVAMQVDSGIPLAVLNVDGGMTKNNLVMQFQADLLGLGVALRCPQMAETTALGSAYAAGLAVGYYSDLTELRSNYIRCVGVCQSMSF